MVSKAPELQKILLVEDEEDIRDIVELSLGVLEGFTLKVCSSGREALEAVSGFDPQLILMDVMMPGMDGPATLAAMRARPALADIPVVFLTARVQPDEILEYRRLGATDVIAKPFDPMALAGRLREIWLRQR